MGLCQTHVPAKGDFLQPGEGEPFHFEVQGLSEVKLIEVHGRSLGDLRRCVQEHFGVPPFEQKLQFKLGSEFIPLEGDDSVLIEEKPGLSLAGLLMLVRQLDPRHKTEKEIAFLEALVDRRFSDAQDIFKSSGVSIDPNCVHKHRIHQSIHVSECPRVYAHPAMTVAIQAGLEDAVHWFSADPVKIGKFMSQADEVAEIVQLLIERGGDVNATGEETQDCQSAGCPTIHGKTPLCAAVQRGDPSLVKLLLDAKADPDHVHKYDTSAYGPDKRNPFGPGVLKPESWLTVISNGSVSCSRMADDPRTGNDAQILELLREARSLH